MACAARWERWFGRAHGSAAGRPPDSATVLANSQAAGGLPCQASEGAGWFSRGEAWWPLSGSTAAKEESSRRKGHPFPQWTVLGAEPSTGPRVFSPSSLVFARWRMLITRPSFLNDSRDKRETGLHASLATGTSFLLKIIEVDPPIITYAHILQIWHYNTYYFVVEFRRFFLFLFPRCHALRRLCISLWSFVVQFWIYSLDQSRSVYERIPSFVILIIPASFSSLSAYTY